MPLLYIVGGLVSVGLLIYLVLALLKPELFCMTANGVLQLVFYLVVLLVLAKPLGAYMARVYEGRAVALDRGLGWLERLVYRCPAIRPSEEMGWKTYAAADAPLQPRRVCSPSTRCSACRACCR